ncbi:hypothetical protein RHSP_54423 [Rhizobium freirei PRF 81]|uniref:SPW repeat-containing protein n=2 Tax=Rhizobium freirei TaxID=1353277 RepID=N6UUA6_9HYPH|nr:hypothetical protein RHSP_54423 [Rhizobium freirei PRF 81]
MNMRSESLSDFSANAIGVFLVVASATLLFLYPDLPRLAVSTANFVLTGIVLMSGATQPDRQGLEWERIVLAAWLAVSPWVIGVSAVTGLTWTSALCASLVFIPAASVVSQPSAFGKKRVHASVRTEGADRNRRV